jgi:hypothetical protein
MRTWLGLRILGASDICSHVFWHGCDYSEASSGGTGDRSGDPTTDPSSGDDNGDNFGNERL